MVASDRSPLVTIIEDKIPRKKKSFRFDKRWIRKEGLLETIVEGWQYHNTTKEGHFVEKLINCWQAISKWLKKLTSYGREFIGDLKKDPALAKMMILNCLRKLWS